MIIKITYSSYINIIKILKICRCFSFEVERIMLPFFSHKKGLMHTNITSGFDGGTIQCP